MISFVTYCPLFIDQSMYDELDAGPVSDIVEDAEVDETRPQSYYVILASQDQLLLNVTPQAIDVISDVTKVSKSSLMSFDVRT